MTRISLPLGMKKMKTRVALALKEQKLEIIAPTIGVESEVWASTEYVRTLCCLGKEDWWWWVFCFSIYHRHVCECLCAFFADRLTQPRPPPPPPPPPSPGKPGNKK